jgi:hypothetical protein
MACFYIAYFFSGLMWQSKQTMWRSSLIRSLPLLSHLRHPAGCGVGGQTLVAAVLGSAISRAYASDAAEVDGAKPWPRPRRHLYVVLDAR